MKAKISFLAFKVSAKVFPLILSLLKSHIQIFFERNHTPKFLFGSFGGRGLYGEENHKQQLFDSSCMLSYRSEKF